MLTGFDLTNFKAFEKGSVDIKPITILLGANSIGKSSLMQFILLLKQSFNFSDEYESALKLNGEYINLGIPTNVFNNFDTSKSLIFSLKTSKYPNLLYPKNILSKLDANLDVLIREFHFNEKFTWERTWTTKRKKSTKLGRTKLAFENDLILDKFSQIREEYQHLTSSIDRAKKLVKINKNSKKNSLEAESLSYLSGNVGALARDNYSQSTIPESFSLNNFIDSVKLLESIKEAITEELTYQYKIDFDKGGNSLRLVSLKIINASGKVIIGYSKEKSKNGRKIHAIQSDFCDSKITNKYRNIFGSAVEFRLLEMISIREKEISYKLDSSLFVNVLLNCFRELLNPLNLIMAESRINYVSPIRAFPKRYYFLDDAKSGGTFDTIIGENLVEVLKKNIAVRSKVNNWLKRFGFEVNVNKVQDVIHNLKVNQSGLKLDITDVGFGISQILPVIVQGFLAYQESITLIEQPEIHLHPKMQAELADLFIDMVKDDSDINRALLIETHSEYMLRRLRRRISEGKISNQDVAIYFIKKDKKKSIIQEVDISESGAFDWPAEFYVDELDDTIAFIKNQPAKTE